MSSTGISGFRQPYLPDFRRAEPTLEEVRARADSTAGLICDLFAGGGGASTGLEVALGRPIDIAINHDAAALAVHRANHPDTHHLEADIWEAKPKELVRGRRVYLLWASPDCTHFSVAKGGKPRKQNIRSLAWAVTRWAKAVKPAIVMLENVGEFRTWGPLAANGRPDRKRMGETFRRWLQRLENLGYRVEYRVLDASRYGAPTRRRRLFLVARRDGLPIAWPEPTHGPGLLPYRTAAECIDWSLPCPSIFDRSRPLAEKTLWRIAQGIRRFVLESPRPFLVRYNGGLWGQGLTTLDTGLVAPVVAGCGGRAGDSAPTGGAQPLGTITAKNDRVLVVPSLVEMNHSNAPHGLDEPLGVVTTQHNRFNLVAPSLIKVNHGGEEPRAEDLEAPLSTVTAARRGHALVAPTLIQTGYGEREGQAPRALNIQDPLGTVVAGGQKHACVSAFLAKHFGERRGGFNGGDPVDVPMGAITTRDHHAPVAATLVKLRGECSGADLQEPLPTITAGGTHVAEVRAFLTAYYGEDATSGQELLEPLRTITTKHRLGLVTVEGAEFQIVDIGMRMLEPEELLWAQFGPRFAPRYDLSSARSKAAKVRLIGNSVPPEMSYALALANVAPFEVEEENGGRRGRVASTPPAPLGHRQGCDPRAEDPPAAIAAGVMVGPAGQNTQGEEERK